MKRFSVYAVLVFLTLNLMGQNEGYEQYYRHINEHISNGNCESAQKLYNIFKQESGKSDKDLEARIAQCLSGRQGNSNNGATNAQVGKVTLNVGGVAFNMVWVEGGTFTMGAQNNNSSLPNYDKHAESDENPVHSVTLDGYYIGETEVTQALWKAVMGTNPSYFKGDDLPVENVSWEDICGKDGKGTDPNCFLYKLNRLTGHTFRLPTETEWEFAARGGAGTSLYSDENIRIDGANNSPNLDNLAWYGGNCGRNYTSSAGCDVSHAYDISGWSEKQYSDSKGGTHPVGKKTPNAYGLYDMFGNVWEWCSDWYGSYGSGSQRNPQGPSEGSYRVCRGGSWNYYARSCRVSNRGGNSPAYRDTDIGFRLAFRP